MALQSEIRGNALLITAEQTRIDAACAIQFKDQMRTMTQDAPQRVILNLKSVDFIDSSGLGAIVAAMKQLSTHTKLELAALSPTVKKVFRLTRMDSVFPIHDSIETAISGGPHTS